MALGATIYRFRVALSDVDRGVYESLDFRIARHPSETARYLLLRMLAYCLCYESGIAFSKGGLSSIDEPPLCVRDETGALETWIEIGMPSAERLHKASKAAAQVVLFTAAELRLLRREAASREIFRLSSISLQRFEPSFLDALEAALDRNMSFELVRNSGLLYLTLPGRTLEATLSEGSLVE
jgi:uncharacterized protein YaeQ